MSKEYCIQETPVYSGYFGIGLVMEEKEFECFKMKYQDIHGAADLSEYMEKMMLDEYYFLSSKKSGTYFVVTPVFERDYQGVVLVPCFGTDHKANWIFRRTKDGVEKNPNRRDSKCWAEPKLYVVFAEKRMEDVIVGDEKPYTSREELRQEFKDNLEHYLPEDFDWDDHIGVIQYAGYLD